MARSLIWLTSVLLSAAAGSAWCAEARPDSFEEAARGLLSESRTEREAALTRLRSLPDLVGDVRERLAGKDPNRRELALRAAAVLRLSSVLPDLLRLCETTEEGLVPATLGALAEPKDHARVRAAFLARLGGLDAAEGAGVKVAILGSLLRLGLRAPPEVLETLVTDPSYEVRRAALELADRFLAKEGAASGYLPVLKQALRLSPFQLRQAALDTFARLPALTRKEALPLLSGCVNDRDAAVRERCRAAGKAKP